jgi:hypothetical protein
MNINGLTNDYSNLLSTIGKLEKSPLPTILERKKGENE